MRSIIHCPSCGRYHRAGEPGCPAALDDTGSLSTEEARELAHLPADPLIGQMIGEYEVRELLGRGGMGSVYGAVHPIIDKHVAIKVLLPSLSHDPEGKKRFVAEARAVNRIRHRNIVDVFSFGTLPDGAQYMVMERLTGRTLAAYLAEKGTLPYSEALLILRQVLDALEAAHERNIVHRDLKPQNIFLCDEQDGSWLVKLMDFGIAKFADETGSTHMTKTGVPMGTPLYMAPEQCYGRGVDHRSDIYSLGVILYRMFCGGEPFSGNTPVEVMLAQMTLPPPPPTQFVSIPQELERVILWCLAKKKEERPQSIGELRSVLMPLLENLAAQGERVGPSTITHVVPSSGSSVEFSHEAVQEGIHALRGIDPTMEQKAIGSSRALLGEETLPSVVEKEGKRQRRALVWGSIGVVILVMGIMGVFFFWPGRREPPQPAVRGEEVSAGSQISSSRLSTEKEGGGGEARRPALLQVVSKPPGAKIFVNGTDTGRVTPALLEGLAENRSHRLELRLEGYEPWRAEPDPTLQAGVTTAVYAELKKKSMFNRPGVTKPARLLGGEEGMPGGREKAPRRPEPQSEKKRPKLIDDI